MTFSKTTSNKKLISFNSIINFGKYEGCTIKEVYLTDASYLLWVIENTDRFSLSVDDEDKIYKKAEKEHKDYLRDNYDPGDGYDWYDKD